MIMSWLKFFRLPNLATAPGDAMAGAAVAMALTGNDDMTSAVAAGLASLFLYMYGLADNDIVGSASECDAKAKRPIPAGEISLTAARVARYACFIIALAIAFVANFSPLWWYVAFAILFSIKFYNRLKSCWLMGLCRALSVFSGAAALYLPQESWDTVIKAVGVMSAGWMFYTAAITKISEGEENDVCEALGASRYFYCLSALIPLGACFFFTNAQMCMMPILGCVWAAAAWCVSVWPLGKQHTSQTRKQCVGMAIRVMMYLQIGFMLVIPNKEFVIAVLVIYFASRIFKRLAPLITGS